MTAPSGQRLNAAELAQSLLDYIVQAYSVSATADPLPARQVIAAGDMRQVAWDCEQLVVSLAGVEVDVPQDTPVTPNRVMTGVRHVAFTAQVVRCAPTPTSGTNGSVRLPSIEDITAAGMVAFRDAGQLSQAIYEWATRAVSTAGPGGILAAAVGTVAPVGPQGAFAAMEGQVVVTANLVD